MTTNAETARKAQGEGSRSKMAKDAMKKTASGGAAKPAEKTSGKNVERAFSTAPWEAQIGYCRALRIGAHVWVTGSTAVRADGQVFGRGDPELQAGRCLDVIEEALRRVGASMGHVVRTRMFVTDIRHWEAVGRAHHARFSEFPPATSMVEVSGLIHPDMLVEVEAEAYVREDDA